MGKMCPSCGNCLDDVKHDAFCPFCKSKLPKDLTHTKYEGEFRDKLWQSRSDYHKARARYNLYVLPVLIVITLIVSIVGAFFHIEFLFGLIVAAIEGAVLLFEWLYFKMVE